MVLCRSCDKPILTKNISCSKCYNNYCESCLDKKTKELIKLLNDCRDVIVDKYDELGYYLDIRTKNFPNMKKDEINEINHLIVYNKSIIHEMKQIMFQYFMILNPRIQLNAINYEFDDVFDYYICFNCKTYPMY